jgi:hypothetical protein
VKTPSLARWLFENYESFDPETQDELIAIINKAVLNEKALFELMVRALLN